MSRSRGSEVPQRPSPTLRGPSHLKISSSDSDSLHRRPLTDRSPKIGEHRSPRSVQSDPMNKKKLGTRITDLETQLVQAQHELKSLKHQLASAEVAKKKAQEELHKKGIKKQTVTRKVQGREKPTAIVETRESNPGDKPGDEVHDDLHRETDVFEVPVEKMLVEPKPELSDSSVISEPEKPSLYDELVSKREEIDQLKDKMEEKEKEMRAFAEENETLKCQLEEARSQVASAHGKEQETAAKLKQVEQELEASKENETRLKEKLLEAEGVKESLENEMRKMKVQTEQWRKVADAAAAVLAGGSDINGHACERSASMDKQFNGVIFEPPVNVYGGYVGSLGSGDDDMEGGVGGGKKKGSGIRVLGDLWKKKGQK